jgi:hypothetical protein
MGGQTVIIVTATVPSDIVQRLRRRELERPPVLTAEPYPVPPARPVPVLPEQLTVEQVAQLRAENAMLRDELTRARTS